MSLNQDVWDSKQVTSAEIVFDGPGIFNVDGEAVVLQEYDERHTRHLQSSFALQLTSHLVLAVENWAPTAPHPPLDCRPQSRNKRHARGSGA